MRRLPWIVTISLGTFLLGLPFAAAQESAAQGSGQNSYNRSVAVQVNLYKVARDKAAPGPCEKSTAWFVRIGEPHAGNDAEAQRAARESFSWTLSAQVNRYQSIRAVLAPRAAQPRLSGEGEALPASMASNSDAQSDAQSADESLYGRTIAEQARLNRLAEAVRRF